MVEISQNLCQGTASRHRRLPVNFHPKKIVSRHVRLEPGEIKDKGGVEDEARDKIDFTSGKVLTHLSVDLPGTIFRQI